MATGQSFEAVLSSPLEIEFGKKYLDRHGMFPNEMTNILLAKLGFMVETALYEKSNPQSWFSMFDGGESQEKNEEEQEDEYLDGLLGVMGVE